MAWTEARGSWMWVQIVTTVKDGGPLWLIYVLRSWVVEDEIGVQSKGVLHFCQLRHRLLFFMPQAGTITKQERCTCTPSIQIPKALSHLSSRRAWIDCL